MIAASLLLAAATASTPGAHPPIDASFWMCRAARAQQGIERRWRQFEYEKEDVVEKIEEGKVQSRESELRYVHRARPSGIAVNELIGVNGEPLPPAEAAARRAAAEERLRTLRDDPREFARSLAKARRDSDEKASTMAAMNEAFHLRYEGLDWIDGEACHVISFFPRPDYRPATKSQETFGKMAGVAWIRERDPVFLRLEADFIDNASAKFGPFATITKGSHLKIVQGDAVPGRPLAFVVDLDLYLRLFFVVHRNERRVTLYRKFKHVIPEGRQAEP